MTRLYLTSFAICIYVVLLAACSDMPPELTPRPSPTPTPPPEQVTLPAVTRVDTTLPEVAFVTAVAEGPDGRHWAGVFDRIGLYVSDDEGRTWQPAPNWPPGPVYDFLTVDGTLLLASEHGIVTIDGRQVWSEDVAVYDLARDGDTVYAATTDAGLWKRAEEQWQRLAVPMDAMLLSVSAAGNRLIVGTSGAGAWQSSDGGQTWSQIAPTEDDYVSVVLVLDETTAFVRTLDALLRTTDGGATWTDVSPSQRVFDLLTEGDRLYAALRKGGVVVSDDRGETWRSVAPGLIEARETIALAKTRNGNLVAGTRDGVYRLSGDRWHRYERGLGQTALETLARVTDTTGTPALLAGHLNGLYRSTDGGRTWRFAGHELNGKSVMSLAVSPWDDRIFAGTFAGGLWVSEDTGRTWTWTDSDGALAKQSLPSLLPHPSIPNRLFTRVAYERVYESNDAGRTWQPRWEGLGRAVEVFALTFDEHVHDRLYAGGHNGLYRSDDEGQHWQRVAPSLVGQSVLALHSDSHVPDRLWIGTTRGLYISDDAGETARPTTLQGVTVRLLDGGPDGTTLLAGTQRSGLWWPTADGWTPLPELDGRQINGLVWQDATTALVATDDGLFSVQESGSTRATMSENSSLDVWTYGSMDGKRRSLLPTSSPPHLPTSTHSHVHPATQPAATPAIHLLYPTDHLFRTAAEHGARAVVVVFPWREIEPNQNEFHWDDTDAWVRAAEYYGLDLIVRLDQTPTWALADAGEEDESEVLNAPPADIVDWADFVRRISDRYRGRIAGYVVWNEPNLAIEWGNRRPDPAEYVDLLKLAHRVIRGEDPDAAVVAAGLAMTNQHDETAMDERAYLRAMYAADADGYFHALAAHPYGFGRPPDAPRDSDDRLVFERLDDLRQIMKDAGDGETPIWVTEFGWPTAIHPDGQPAVTPAQQSGYLAQAYTMLIERDWIDLAAVWHVGNDVPDDDEKAGFNLLDGNGTPVPALRRLASVFPSRETTPTPIAPIALGPDTPIHLGDSELPPPWWPLYRGINPSTTWEGGFYLADVPADGGTLFLEMMQHNEPGSTVMLNGQNVLLRPLPAEDFSATWVTYRVPVTRQQLQRGYNTITIRAGRLLPDFQQDGFVWDDIMIRNVRFTP